MTKTTVQFSEPEQKFIDLWDGDVDSTAHKAGISGRDAGKLLRNIAVRDAIRDRGLIESKSRKKQQIADRLELQEFWSKIMRNELIRENGDKEAVDLDTRVKASELLAKSDGGLTERRIHTGENGGPIATANLDIHVKSIDLEERARLLVHRRAVNKVLFLE